MAQMIPEDFRKAVVSVYEKVIGIPSLDQGFFVGGDATCVNLISSQTDVTTKKNRSYLTQRYVDSTGKAHGAPFPVESTTGSAVVAPGREKWLAIREVTATPDQAELGYTYDFVLTSSSGSTVVVQSKDVHRGICQDEWFGKPVFSKCERFVAYVAEARSNTTSFFDKDPKEKVVGDQFTLREDWGETYVGLTSPSVFVLDLEKKEVVALEPFPSDKISAGHLTWSPEGGLVFAGWDVTHRKLGIRACYNRISSLYYIDLQQYLKEREVHKKKLADGEKSPTKPNLKPVNLLPDEKYGYFRSPRFTPNGKDLVFLGFDERFFAHNSCSKMFRAKWNQGKPLEGYVTIVGDKNFSDEFKGIYNAMLPLQPFVNNETLVFSTNVASVQCTISVNVHSLELRILNDPHSTTSVNVMDIVQGQERLLLSVSRPDQPASVIVAPYPAPGTFLNLTSGYVIDNTRALYPIFGTQSAPFRTTVLRVPVDKATAQASPGIDAFEVVYLQQNEGKGNKRLILYPHGGPHGAFTTEYSFALAFLMSQGYNVALVNFRGSTGFGKDFVECLPGKCGDLDVKDCLTATHFIYSYDSSLNQNETSCLGGSHSGFLCAFLATYPEYKASIIRNPVTDIAALSIQSDIPDWSFYEAGIPPPTDSAYYPVTPTIKDLEIMRNCSPITLVHKVTAPTLILLGNADLRVPFSQGLLYYRALKEHKATVKCNMYPKAGHSLDTIDCKLDQWIQIAHWLELHSKQK